MKAEYGERIVRGMNDAQYQDAVNAFQMLGMVGELSSTEAAVALKALLLAEAANTVIATIHANVGCKVADVLDDPDTGEVFMSMIAQIYQIVNMEVELP